MSVNQRASQKDDIEWFPQCYICFDPMEFTKISPENYRFNNQDEPVCHFNCWMKNVATCDWCNSRINSTQYQVHNITKMNPTKMDKLDTVTFYYHFECYQKRNYYETHIIGQGRENISLNSFQSLDYHVYF
jgi:hypothetical protein